MTAKPITFTSPNTWLNSSTVTHFSVWDSATGGNRIDLDDYIDSFTVDEPRLSEFDDDIAEMQTIDGTVPKAWWTLSSGLNLDSADISVKLYTKDTTSEPAA